jgi:transposase
VCFYRTRPNPPFYFLSYTTMERSFGTVISGNRRRKAELSPEQRTAIISKHESGHTPTKLACEFDCARSTIYDTLERFKQHNTVKSLPRSGRPMKISPRAARQIYQLARRNPNWSYLALRSQLPNPPCKSTIRSILIKYGLRKRRTRKRIPLKVNSARARYRFALRWLRYRTWDRWIFSDECSVERHSKTIGSGSGWVWRFTSEAYRRDLVNIVPCVRDIL